MKLARQTHIHRLSAFIFKHRNLFIICLGIISIFSDLLVLIKHPESVGEISFFLDLIVHGILVPLSVGIALFQLERIERDRQFSSRQIELQKYLSIQIEKAKDWNELVGVIVQFLHAVIPYTGAYFWLCDKETNQMTIEAGWGFIGTTPPVPPTCSMGPIFLSPDSAGKFYFKDGKSTMIQVNSSEDDLDFQKMGILFSYGDHPIGFLYCYLPGGYPLSEPQVELISSLSNRIAQALHDFRNNDAVTLQNVAIQEERRRIAKNLHDTLAQDLAYLRREIEQFSELHDRNPRTLVNIQHELSKLRKIADEAYDEIRNTLEILEIDQKKNLVAALEEFIGQFSSRTNLITSFINKGRPGEISSEVQTQVVYILRELLANIEFHAHASQAKIELSWMSDHLLLQVEDDGQGFIPNVVPQGGHFGLRIMQERAKQINGELSILSTPGKGTRVKLWIPIIRANDFKQEKSLRWLTNFDEKAVIDETINRR